MAASDLASANAPLGGLEILLVEDEAIIALMVEHLLCELGCRTVWHASRVGEALKLIADRLPAAAILDVNLGGDVVFAAAERLDAAGIPFVFTTGYERDVVPERWRDRPFVQKPVEAAQLAAALKAALGR